MINEYKKLREDLIVSQQEEGEQAYYVVKDPITRRFFRFRSPEYFIASRLDGRTSMQEIRQKFREEFEADLPGAKLERFIQRLQGLCLIESDLTNRELSKLQKRASLEGNRFRRLLFIKIKAVSPDRILDSIVSRMGFFFTRRFVWFTVALTIVAIMIVVSNWGDFTAQMVRLFGPRAIPTFILVVLVVTGLHELAHGLTCKHYGGRVHEIGFLLIYFLPAFYCNVSDAWLFKEKGKRLWVSFAGVFFQIFIWAAAAVVWRLIDMETWLSEACCITMATSGLTALFNFNPLIKLDGYYLLSDHLDIPNLRKEAFGYMGSRLKWLFVPRDGKSGEVTGRQRKIYLLYGITAGVYSIALLLFIFIKIVGFVFSEFHGMGLLALSCIILLVFAGSYERWTVRIRGLLKGGEDVNARRKNRVAWIVVCAIIAGVLVFGVWELKISSKFKLLPGSRANIRTEVAGSISEIYVDEGDTVIAGDLIARLDDTSYMSEAEKTESEIAKRRAELELLKKGPLEEEVNRLRKLVERERTKVSYAEKEFERISELYSKNLIAPVEYERSLEDLNVRKKELEHAESDLEVLLVGNRPEEIEAARAEMERLNASHKYLQQQIEWTRIVSPISGVVSTHHLKDRLKEHLAVGDEICRIVNCRTMALEMLVSEKDVADVRIGQKVKFKVRPLPGKAFYGRVTAIAPVAINNDNHTVVVVTSEVDNSSLLLKPGMTGKAKVYCGKRRILFLLTRRIVRFIRVEFWL